MFVRRLTLTNFRSWDTLDAQLRPGVSVFVGRNGFGKTNIVEAVDYLATLSSHRVSTDQPLVQVGSESARIEGVIENRGRELTVAVDILPGRTNRGSINGAPCRRPRELLGITQTVLFAPEDLQLVRGDPTGRRRYLDDLAAARTPRMAAERADYERVLRQRNALLKTAGAALRRGGADAEGVLATLDVWDIQLARYGAELLSARLRLIEDLEPFLVQTYHQIAPHSRPAMLAYQSSLVSGNEHNGPATPARLDPASSVAELESIFLQRLSESRQRDLERGQSLVGPHRDDLLLLLGQEPAKGFASHGESWSYALALRLAALALHRADGDEPILILDDVFAELDALRRSALVQVVGESEQVLVTAAVPGDLPAELASGSAHFEVSVTGPVDSRRSILTPLPGNGT